MKKHDFKKIIKKTPIVCLTAIFCCALWGSAFAFIKIGYSMLDIKSDDSASQILFAGLRFLLAGILTVLISSVLSKKILVPKKKSYLKITVLSLFQTVFQYLFFYIGLAHITGSKGSVINSLSSFFAVILVAAAGMEKLSFNKVLGCVLGFAGVVAVNFNGLSLNSDISFLGDGFIVLSALSYAVSSVLIKKYSQYENPAVLSGYQFAFGGIVMIAAGLIFGGRLSGINIKSVLLIVYLALVSAAAYTLWGILLKYNDVSKVAVFGFMTPVFGCILSVLILKENFASSFINSIVSLVLVSCGIIIVNKREKVW